MYRFVMQALEFGEIKQMADKAGLFKLVIPIPPARSPTAIPRADLYRHQVRGEIYG